MSEALEEVFRQSSAALVASLTRAVGPSHLDLVESVVQEAFLRAMEEWRGGAPNNPAGWLLAVAKNLALDQLRRERTFRSKEDGVAHFLETTAISSAGSPDVGLKGELADEQLAMIFVACHPCNSVPSQIALALRTLCGLEIPAIARALFSSEDAIEKRLVLARRRIREENVSFDLPSPSELGERLDAVLRVLYLVFNEAYWGTTGPHIVHEDAAAEAIRLVAFLAEHPTTRRPRVLALLALMHFHASRFPARVDAEGNLVTLADQDRSLWNHRFIEHGMRCLAASAEGDDASPYHYEAAIAAAHAMSPSPAATDWTRIVVFYEQLLALSPSPGARLSRAIAVGFRDGPAACLTELARLEHDGVLRGLAPFHAARGDAHARLGDAASARAAFERARACSTNAHEQRYLDGRIARLSG
jgi:predicted RNA polymerase sigma factor